VLRPHNREISSALVIAIRWLIILPAMDNVCSSFHLNKSSAVAEIGNRGHNRYGQKIGVWCCAPFAAEGAGSHVTQCGLGRGLLPHQVESSSIQPYGYNKHELKTGGCDGRGELRPHLTQLRLGRGLPPYQVAC